MSNTLALHPSPSTDQKTAKPAARASLGSILKSALEALVVSQRNRFDESDVTFYRYPPF